MNWLILISFENISSIQDFFTVGGSLWPPLILGALLLMTYGLFVAKSKLDIVSSFYFLMFFVMGLAGWSNPVLGFTQAGLSGDFEKILVLLFLLVAGGVGLVWLKLSQKN